MGKYLGVSWTRERLAILNSNLDRIVQEQASDTEFQRSLGVLLELARVEEWPHVEGVLRPEPVYRLTHTQLIRLLMVTAVAAQLKGKV